MKSDAPFWAGDATASSLCPRPTFPNTSRSTRVRRPGRGCPSLARGTSSVPNGVCSTTCSGAGSTRRAPAYPATRTLTGPRVFVARVGSTPCPCGCRPTTPTSRRGCAPRQRRATATTCGCATRRSAGGATRTCSHAGGAATSSRGGTTRCSTTCCTSGGTLVGPPTGPTSMSPVAPRRGRFCSRPSSAFRHATYACPRGPTTVGGTCSGAAPRAAHSRGTISPTVDALAAAARGSSRLRRTTSAAWGPSCACAPTTTWHAATGS